MGVLSALPIISVGNVCCCLWVVSGGVVAAYLLQQNQREPISAGDGAMVGLLAGLLGAVICSVLSIPLNLLMAPLQREMMERFANSSANLPPEVRDAFENVARGRGPSGGMRVVFGFIGFIVMLFAGAIFSTLGGLLGAAIFAKKVAPTPTPTPSA
jgi:hypothetical protein